MEQEMLASTWPNVFFYEFAPDTSDITSEAIQKNTQNPQLKSEAYWLKGVISAFPDIRSKKVTFTEGELEYSDKLWQFLRTFSREQNEQKMEAILRTIASSETESISKWPNRYQFSEPVSSSCREFADWHGLNETLEKCFHEARKVFSNVRALCAELDQFKDQEPEDIGHIVIRVEVASDREAVLREYDLWTDWIIRNLTPEENERFTLTLRRVENGCT
jgi:ferritin